MDSGLSLNGFKVDGRLARLMQDRDWPGKRSSNAWLEKFPSLGDEIPFVQLFSIDQAIRENAHVRHSDLHELTGQPDTKNIPGNFDPYCGYLIGMVDHVDSGIAVDLRDQKERVIYEALGPNRAIWRTAFDTIAEFVDFYMSQHGEDSV